MYPSYFQDLNDQDINSGAFVFKDIFEVFNHLRFKGWNIGWYAAPQFECIEFPGNEVYNTPWPVAPLFRGQHTYYSPSKPSLYRRAWSAAERLERLVQLEDFKHILSRNPEVQDLQQAGINVNYSGLAQHYGIETHIMDLTNSFGVAAFFATSRYDALTGSYTPIRDCLTRGVIYFNQLGLHYFNSTGKNIVLPIGLDVLPRPGEQRGYGVHMEPEDDFNELFPCKSYFWQNEKASIRCQELMGFGKFLFPYDPMVEKIRAMQTYKLYGKDSVEKVISSSEEFTGYTLEQAITMLTDRGCTLLPTTPFHYTKEETEYITERYHKRYPSEFQTQ